MSLKEAALKYLERGWHPIPVDMSTKRPHVKWADYREKQPNSIEVTEWWQTWPDAGIALLCGPGSNMVVIDVDVDKGATLDLRSMPETYTVKTPGGYHLYYRHPGKTIKSRINLQGKHVDLMGDTSFVFAPPTVKSDGSEYKVIHDVPLAPYTFKEDLNIDDLVFEDPDPLWKVLLAKPAPEGTRQDTLARAAGSLAAEGVSKPRALYLLSRWAEHMCKPPLDSADVSDCIDRIYKAEAKKEQAVEEILDEAEELEDDTDEFGLIKGLAFFDKHKDFKTEWLVEGWIPKAAIGMMVSPPECFKTWICGEMALSVATGRKAFGEYECQAPGGVFIYQVEDNFGETALRYITQADGLYEKRSEDLDNLYFSEDRGFHFTAKDKVANLIKAIKKYRPKLVILDPLYSIVNTDGNLVDAPKQMKVLKLLRDRYEVSFLLVHHAKKQDGASVGRERMFGSQLLNAFLEYGIQVFKPKDGESVATRHSKVAKAPEPAHIVWDMEKEESKRYYRPAARKLTSDELQEILDEMNTQIVDRTTRREGQKEPETVHNELGLEYREDHKFIEQRMFVDPAVYEAVAEGFSTKPEIASRIGEDDEVVGHSLQELKKKGKIRFAIKKGEKKGSWHVL